MTQNGEELLNLVLNKLDKALNIGKGSKQYSFDQNVYDVNEITKHQYNYDIVIKYRNNPIAIVEVKTNVNYFRDILLQLKSNPLNCRYLIITSSELLYIYDRQKDLELSEYRTFDDLLVLFSKKINQEEQYSLKVEFANALFKFLFDFNQTKDYNKNDIKNELGISFDILLNNLNFDIEKNELSFSTEDFKINHIEAKIFDYLLPDINYKTRNNKQSIYRYTTLDTLHKTLDNRKYRINGIRGMNDPSDGIFIDKLISPYSNFEDEDIVHDLNKKFISSCSLIRDNLTMWRLYGDNSKGICIELEVTKPLNNSNFFIKNIVYVRNENDPAIDFFKNIFEYSITKGITFKFKWFDAFKLFFKSDDYSIEKEVRLLYVNENNIGRNWMIAKPYGILNPSVDFDLLIKPQNMDLFVNNPNLPFRIKKTILGPNCPFKEKNLGQIKNLMKEKRFEDIEIKLSKIKSDTYIV